MSELNDTSFENNYYKLLDKFNALHNTFNELFHDMVDEISRVNKLKGDQDKITNERRDAIRYEKVRKLSVLQFSEVFASSMKHNIRFDDAIDNLPEPWRYSDRYYSDISTETLYNINMNEETVTTSKTTTINIFNDYIKLQRKYDLLKMDYDTLQSKSSAALKAWNSTWAQHSPELCTLWSALKDLCEVLDDEIDRKND